MKSAFEIFGRPRIESESGEQQEPMRVRRIFEAIEKGKRIVFEKESAKISFDFPTRDEAERSLSSEKSRSVYRSARLEFDSKEGATSAGSLKKPLRKRIRRSEPPSFGLHEKSLRNRASASTSF